jgi:2'-5' RNA ligase
MTRVFLAFELPDTVRATIAARVSELARGLPGVRFTAPATWHLTLAFLGELDDAQVMAANAAATVARSHGPIQLALGQIGTFGRPDAPRVIWLGLRGDIRALEQFQRQVVATLAHHDLRCDDRFAPHITLARPKRPLAPTAAQFLISAQSDPAPSGAWVVNTLSVMRSQLTPQGAQYTPLLQAPLAPRHDLVEGRPED